MNLKYGTTSPFMMGGNKSPCLDFVGLSHPVIVKEKRIVIQERISHIAVNAAMQIS